MNIPTTSAHPSFQAILLTFDKTQTRNPEGLSVNAARKRVHAVLRKRGLDSENIKSVEKFPIPENDNKNYDTDVLVITINNKLTCKQLETKCVQADQVFADAKQAIKDLVDKAIIRNNTTTGPEKKTESSVIKGIIEEVVVEDLNNNKRKDVHCEQVDDDEYAAYKASFVKPKDSLKPKPLANRINNSILFNNGLLAGCIKVENDPKSDALFVTVKDFTYEEIESKFVMGESFFKKAINTAVEQNKAAKASERRDENEIIKEIIENIIIKNLNESKQKDVYCDRIKGKLRVIRINPYESSVKKEG